MQINLDASTSPVRASATVVLVRDGAAGMEVFLLKRHGLSDVLGGAYVFPGGKVDMRDASPELAQLMDLGPADLPLALNEPGLAPADAMALYVGALREAFEETGVLFAQGQADAELAWRLLREGRAFDEVLLHLSLRLQASALHPWSRWITPAVGGVMKKRFDTRFFLARLPQGQVARHDNHEAVDSIWVTPHEALTQYWERKIELAPPQIMSLAHLSRHSCVQSAIDEARSRRPPLIQPEPFQHEGMRVICYPGDQRHPVQERALPGPTRLHYRDERFEPDGGFNGWFAPG